jgi:predicted DNA-binding protein (MmcQ/YjbR family)
MDIEPMPELPPAIAALKAELLRFALTLPDAHEDHPWGEVVVKVRNKIFVFCGGYPGQATFSLKLPRSQGYALSLPCATPTGYGLGRSGWVTFLFAEESSVQSCGIDVALFQEWIMESYRTIAPKKLAALIDLK